MTQPVPTHGSARRPAFLGVDLGTSAVKVVLTGVGGRVVAQADRGYAVTNAHAGWSESDPREWLTATIDAVRMAVARADADVLAIGFSGQMHGVVVCDAGGAPVRPAMLWSDSRATEQLRAYERLPVHVRARLANPLSPGMAGPLLSWLTHHEPGVYAATRWALSPKDWLRSRLTDEFFAEPSDASATLLYDLTTDSWDEQVVDVLGLDAGKLPPILPASSRRAGELTSGAAEQLGLRAGIPVAAGAADTAAAALGSGLVDADAAQVTIGTGAQVVRPVMELPQELSTAPVTHVYRAATDAGWYGMAASLNGGSTLTWVRSMLGASWQELYRSAERAPRKDDPMFLPHLHGERTPYLDPQLRGAWVGLTPRSGREHLLRAALEGVAFAVRQAADSLLPRHAVPELRLAGGGTAGQAWRQMLADVLEYPVTPVDVPAASGRGAAMLAQRVSGVPEGGGPDDEVLGVRATTAPHPDRSRAYRDRYAAYREAVEALRRARRLHVPEPAPDGPSLVPQ